MTCGLCLNLQSDYSGSFQYEEKEYSICFMCPSHSLRTHTRVFWNKVQREVVHTFSPSSSNLPQSASETIKTFKDAVVADAFLQVCGGSEIPKKSCLFTFGICVWEKGVCEKL